MKKKLIPALAILLAMVFLWIPLPASDLILRVHFDEIAGDSCDLYYGTDVQGSFSDEQHINAKIDHEKKLVEFRLEGSLQGHLTALRLDWPNLTEQLICVKSIAVSSGGAIRKEFNPCYFFAQGNVPISHETAISLVYPRDRAYLQTGADDPYLILSDGLVAEIGNLYSRRLLSRLFLCLFLAGSFVLARRKLFH